MVRMRRWSIVLICVVDIILLWRMSRCDFLVDFTEVFLWVRAILLVMFVGLPLLREGKLSVSYFRESAVERPKWTPQPPKFIRRGRPFCLYLWVKSIIPEG